MKLNIVYLSVVSIYMKNKHYIALFSLALMVACSTTKNIPDGQYLLNDIEVKTDSKVSTPNELETFARQQPNASLPLLGKVRLKIYNLAGDTGKWINRNIRKIGEKPVLYSPSLTVVSASQIKKEMLNLGYLEAEVDTLLKINNKKINVTYSVKTGTPYKIRNIDNSITDTTISKLVDNTPFRSQLKSGGLFNMADLENERIRVNNILRNNGYYTFSKEYVYFKADTTLNSHQVDLYLDVYPSHDSLPYSQYKINKVTVVSGYDFNKSEAAFFKNSDTTNYKGITIIRGRNNFLKSSTIERNNFMKPGRRYMDLTFNNTYQAYNNIGAIKQTNIVLTPSTTDSTHLLDARITLSPANAHWLQASIDGTNSAGDIGVAPTVAYQHQNIFNGGEQFSIKLKGAYEFVTGDKNTDMLNENYYEYGFDIGLTYPKVLFPFLRKKWRDQPSANTRFNIGLMNQHRSEYTRQFFNTTVNYGWSTAYGRYRYSLDFLDINYVRMPSVSKDFEERYLTGPNSNPLLRESYKDQFVVRTALSATLSGNNIFKRSPHTYTIRSSFEVAGWLPRLVTSINGQSPNNEGFRKILGVQYAEYVKGSIDYARTFNFTKKRSLAYHLGLGVAYPYGNSNVLPFERRFFAGGANSIRGWSTRSLGPGSHKSSSGSSNFVNQTGDIKFEASIESRHKLGDMFEVAGFFDMGNIWTIHNYQGQENGQFKLSEFYKEIAMAYGLGIRIDLSFLLLRFDTGMRLYDPARKQSERLVLPAWSRMAFHFGIGYPF